MRVIVWFGLLGFLLPGCGDNGEPPEVSPGSSALSMFVRSPAFEDKQEIPRKFTCDGKDVSPSLTFSAVPEDAESLALLVEDPDAPRGTFVHWIIWNIPAGTDGLGKNIPRGRTVESLDGAAQGKNGFGSVGYRGPCPPEGPEHRYRFRVYALDTAVGLAPGSTRKRFDRAIEGHVLRSGVLVGTYGR